MIVRLVGPYVHVLAALAAACVAGLFGADPILFMVSLPGTDSVDMTFAWAGLVPAGFLGALAFWAVGHWPPLLASLVRTATCGLVATGVLLFIAAQVGWLTGDGALLLSVLGVATLGFVPFGWNRRGDEAVVKLVRPEG